MQIKLAPVNAPYFNGSKLLIAADCTAYAYAAFHQDFIRIKVTLIGCPKLDQVDYSEKLTAIIQNNNIQSVTTVSYTHLADKFTDEEMKKKYKKKYGAAYDEALKQVDDHIGESLLR